MAIYQVNYQGLKKPSDYEDLVYYVLFNQPKIPQPIGTEFSRLRL